MLDVACSLLLAGGLVLVALVYGLRVLLRGAASYDRVQRDQGSALFGTGAMAMGYWALTPLGDGLARLGISADAISWGSLVFGLAAGGALATGHLGLGALLATLSALGDTLDGMVARKNKTASDAGEVLDAAVDRYVEFFFLGGLAVAYRADPLRVCLALAALLGSFMVSYATAKAEALKTEVPRGAMRRPERAAYLTLGAALSPLAAAWAIPAGQPLWVADLPMLLALGLVALVANASAIGRLAALARKIRARAALPSSADRDAGATPSPKPPPRKEPPAPPRPGLGRMVN